MSRRLALVVLLVVGGVLGTPSWAQVGAEQSPDWVAENYPDGLPKYLTPEEALIPFETPSREDFIYRAPPTGAVYCPSEYDPQQGLFMSWEAYTDILTTMTVNITTLDPTAIVYMVVDTASEQTSVTSTLTAAGADMTQVRFLVRTTDTVWIRDYGPRFIFENRRRAIIDHTYNRPRPNDNLLNDYISAQWGETQYDIPLTHGGGNFHLFADRDAFMTTLILDENPGLTAQNVIDLYHQYQNLNLTIFNRFPSSYDSTGHIDMWMLPVANKKVIIGQYPSSAGTPYTITENAVTTLTARGYTVYRTPGWNSGGTHYTYTNAVVINDLVLVPRFGGSYTSQDAQALAVFQTAFPGYTLIQVNCASIIGAAGAMHCIVMHVPKYPVPGDLSHDGDVTIADYPTFQQCLAGPDVTTPPSGCDAYDFLMADLDRDGDVDLEDWAEFVLLF